MPSQKNLEKFQLSSLQPFDTHYSNFRSLNVISMFLKSSIIFPKVTSVRWELKLPLKHFKGIGIYLQILHSEKNKTPRNYAKNTFFFIPFKQLTFKTQVIRVYCVFTVTKQIRGISKKGCTIKIKCFKGLSWDLCDH